LSCYNELWRYLRAREAEEEARKKAEDEERGE